MFKKQSKFTVVATFILTVALLCGTSFVGAYAAPNSTTIASAVEKTEQVTKELFILENEFSGVLVSGFLIQHLL